VWGVWAFAPRRWQGRVDHLKHGCRRRVPRLATQRPDQRVPSLFCPRNTRHCRAVLPSSNIDSTYLGMVGMPPSGESLDQPGRSHERLSRDVTKRMKRRQPLG